MLKILEKYNIWKIQWRYKAYDKFCGGTNKYMKNTVKAHR